MNGWQKWWRGILAAVVLGLLGVLGNGWLSHADKESLKAEKAERKESDARLERQDEKIAHLIADIREKADDRNEQAHKELQEIGKTTARTIAILEQLEKRLEENK